MERQQQALDALQEKIAALEQSAEAGLEQPGAYELAESSYIAELRAELCAE